jgi:ABC-type bacteriocin/lantibiotic exporter with double-glycine peptidase domain
MNTKTNTKPLPIIICLAASGIICVISIIQGVDFGVFVKRFALVALIFYVLGVIVRVVIDRTFKIDMDETIKQQEMEDETRTETTGGLEDMSEIEAALSEEDEESETESANEL